MGLFQRTPQFFPVSLHNSILLFSQHVLTAFASLASWTFFDKNKLKEILHSTRREISTTVEISKNTSFDESIETFDQLQDDEETPQTDSERSFEELSAI